MLIPDVQMNSTPTSNCSISATWKNAQKGTYFPRVSQRISRKFREENPNYQKEEIKPNETLLSRPYDAELFAMVAKALRLYGASTACADVAPTRVARALRDEAAVQGSRSAKTECRQRAGLPVPRLYTVYHSRMNLINVLNL